jgi:hypothetical protein
MKFDYSVDVLFGWENTLCLHEGQSLDTTEAGIPAGMDDGWWMRAKLLYGAARED